MSRWWDSAAVLAVMFCAAKALYTLHQKNTSFDGALKACLTDGFLASMADQEENKHILSSVSATLKSAGVFYFWVGLWKPAGICAQEDLPLHGFVWKSSNSNNSGVSQWRRTPIGTCTSDRCGLLSLDFDGGKVTGWGWIDSSCARAYWFICKKKPGGSPPPDVPGDGSPCSDGRTPCGKPQPPSRPPHTPTVLPSPGPSPSRSPEEERISTPSPAPSLTSSSSVTTQIRDSTSDKYSIFIPVLVALLVLVVLVVVVLAVFKCCFKKKPKKASNSKNGGKREVTVDLSATDLDRDETTA